MMTNEISSKNLVIRADASIHIGIGHVMRCLALGQAWKDAKGHAIFLMAAVTPALENRLHSEGMEVIQLSVPPGSGDDAKQTAAFARKAGAPWVVVDGYQFDACYQRMIKDSGLQLLFIDDNGQTDRYHADIVLNQNSHAHENLYGNREPHTRLLLGTCYTLLRREFLEWGGWKREIPELAHRVLVSLGGSDPNNVTLKVINALKKVGISDLDVKIVVGPSNPNTQVFQNALLFAPFSMRLLHNVTNMPELMAWADVAISAGGITSWELAFMGVPNMIVVVAENQRQVAENLNALSIAKNLGCQAEVREQDLAQALKMLMNDSAHRKAMSEVGQRLVDGNGIDRIMSSLGKSGHQVSPTDELLVRPARFQDAELLWQWANSPDVRANSFRPEVIPLDQHIEWYMAKLGSSDTRIWILELDKVPVAQIRYDRVDADMAEIDFSVVAGYRGKGLGTKVVALTSGIACRELGVKRLKGVVFGSNEWSMRAFTKAHFDRVGQRQISDRLCYIFIRGCPETNGEVL